MLRVLRQIARVGLISEPKPAAAEEWRGESLQAEIARVFGRALNIRQVDAGSCNGCELEINALENPYYNLGGAGINYQRADGVTLAPIRLGVGLRSGANVGYVHYRRHKSLNPI